MIRTTMKLFLFAALIAGSAAAQIDVYLTRGDQASLLEQRTPLSFAPGTGTHSLKIEIDPTQRFQPMDGFGASVTDSSAWLIQNELSSSQRDDLLTTLFSRQAGIGLNMIRIPMGASDFALTAYTYNDLPPGGSDPNLAGFSIAHDLDYIIPTLQQIQATATDFKLMASPWSPPAWMKNGGTLFGGSLKSTRYAVYADYFALFIADYESVGLPIYAVTPQNEPLNDSTGLPSMSMPTFVQSAFIGDHLGPVLAVTAPDTKILAYDHNWDVWNYPLIIFNDPTAGPYVAGAAFHAYAGVVENQSLLHNQRPDKEIHFTEISGGDFAPNFDDNLVWFMRNIVIGATRNWARSVLYWNLALDQNSGPFLPGGCGDCRGVVTINTGNGAVTFNEEYYGLAHASMFVQPGAVRIGCTTLPNQIEAVAFRNPDCSEVLIALNPTGSSSWFNIVRNGNSAAYRLTGKSVATFRYLVSDSSFDLDGDGSETADDALALVTCAPGPDISVQANPCLLEVCGDLDGDDDLDLLDMAVLQMLPLD